MNGQMLDVMATSENTGPFTALVDGGFCSMLSSQPGSQAASSSPSLDVLKSALAGGNRKKVKALLRTGAWPAHSEVRRELWLMLIKAVLQTPAGSVSIYKDTVRELFGNNACGEMSLPSFVDPGNMHHYHLTKEGVAAAKKVVCTLGKTHPDVVFAPSIFTLTSLLLHYMAEEDAYNCMELLLESKVNYVVQTKIAYEASKHVLKELARKYAKPCYSFLVANSAGSVVKVFDRWLWWLLRDLPFPYLVRLVDCYLYEGPKVLYRIALAVLILFHKLKVKSRRVDAGSEMAASISQFCEEMPGVSVDRLLKTAFGIRGLSRKRMLKLVVQCEMEVQSQHNAAAARPGAAAAASLPKSPSCESLNSRVRVLRTFSVGEIAPSALLTEESQWSLLWRWIPERVSVCRPRRVFSTAEDGVSLRTFYGKVEGFEPTLLVVKAVSGEVFGAYLSADWEQRRHNAKNLNYFGTGETFVFSLSPELRVYPWVGRQRSHTPRAADLWISGDETQISIGGGGGTAIHLDENLDAGRTQTCQTFENPPFVAAGDFRCDTVEAFAFET